MRLKKIPVTKSRSLPVNKEQQKLLTPHHSHHIVCMIKFPPHKHESSTGVRTPCTKRLYHWLPLQLTPVCKGLTSRRASAPHLNPPLKHGSWRQHSSCMFVGEFFCCMFQSMTSHFVFHTSLLKNKLHFGVFFMTHVEAAPPGGEAAS